MWFFEVLSDRESPFYPSQIGDVSVDFWTAYDCFESEIEKCQRFIDTTGRSGLRYKKRTIYLMVYTLDDQNRYEHYRYIYIAKAYKRELILKDRTEDIWIPDDLKSLLKEARK